MRTRHWLLALVVLLLSGSAVRAQDAGQVGLTIAYPASVGVIWHATDQIAVRPDFSFSETTSDTLSTSSSLWNVGVSGLFYFRKWEGLRLYVSPRVGYQRSSFTTTGILTISSPVTAQTSIAGSFGAQYLLHQRFAIFGETGIAYAHSSMANNAVFPNISLDTTTNAWGTRAGVGMIVYF